MSEQRKRYMRDQYSKYWIRARKDTYGVMDYDTSLIKLIDNKAGGDGGKSILDVGIGTGFPIASGLLSLNYELMGIDISSRLVEQCLKDYPSINAVVGDAENMCFESKTFDLVYCLHSSWFMPDINKVIAEMFRVASDDGRILIDIMNINNLTIKNIYRQHVFENVNFFGKIFKTTKNLAKFCLQYGSQDWPFLVSQTPSDPGEIVNQCLEHSGKLCIFSWLDESLKEIEIDRSGMYSEHSRILISCKV